MRNVTAFQLWEPDRYGPQPSMITIPAENEESARQIFQQYCQENGDKYRLDLLKEGGLSFERSTLILPDSPV